MARPRSPAKALTRLLSGVREPLAVLDGNRSLVYCNAACADWLGVEAADILNRVCHYHAGNPTDPLDVAVASLCPPPEVLAGRRMRGRLTSPRADQAPWSDAEFLPLGDAEGQLLAVVIVLHPAGQSGEAGDVASGASGDEAESQHLHEQLQQLRRTLAGAYRLAHIIGGSPAMRRVRDQVRLATRATTRVVVTGPVGSGREHVARTIHYGEDPDGAGPLVPLSCSLLDAELLQTTVTAFARRCAELRSPRPGALLLLDVDALTPETQSELIGFLTLPTFKLHTIATARESPRCRAQRGEFDPALAMLLSTLEIELPPLSDRRDDIPLLAQHFLEEWNSDGGRQLSGFTTEALDALHEYPWPNNLDELRAFVREACERSGGGRVAAADLPKQIQLSAAATARSPRPAEPIVLDDYLAEVEAELIRRALRRSAGNKAKAARLLGISRPRLLRRLEQLKISDS